MFRKMMLPVAALGLVATPLAAEASRASAPVEGESQLTGQTTVFFIAGIAAVIAAIVLLSQNDDDPVSV